MVINHNELRIRKKVSKHLGGKYDDRENAIHRTCLEHDHLKNADYLSCQS